MRVIAALIAVFVAFAFPLQPASAGSFAIFQAARPGCTPNGSDGYSSAASGAAQYPGLLSGYTFRPAWCVAGVDFPVGYGSTTLTDWQTCLSNLQTTYGAGNITSSGTNPTVIVVKYAPGGVTWDSCDFTLHGGAIMAYQGSPNGTIIRSRIGTPNLETAPGSFIFNIDTASPNFTFRYNILDWGLSAPNLSGVSIQLALNIKGGGSTLVEYNWFTGNGTDVIFIDNAALAGSVTIRYNFFDNEYTPNGVHMNWVSWGNGTVNNLNLNYNVGYQTTLGGAEGFQIYFNGSGTFSNPTMSNNVEIALTSGGINTMSYYNHGSNAGGTGTTIVTGTATASNNYADPSGSQTAANNGVFYPLSFQAGAGNSAWSCSGNKNMIDGTTPSC